MRTGSWAAKPKLLVSIFIAITALVSSSMNVYAFAGNGAGGSTDPYEITNCSQLQAVKNNLSASYELMNSIDCAGQTAFMPISGSSAFTGIFDGNNYTIDNLTINPAGNPDNTSLFGRLDGATIRDFTLNHAHITGGDKVGSIAGIASNGATISGIKLLNGTIQGTNQVGGFVGILGTIGDQNTGAVFDTTPALQFSESKNTTVQGSSNTATSEIGGAAGGAGGTIKYVSTEGSVIGNVFDDSMSSLVGGINGDGFSPSYSYSRANVTGGTYVGGLTGYAYHGNFLYTYSSGDVTGDSYVGGIAGITDQGMSWINFSDSIVTGGFPSGGIFGDITENASFVSLMTDSVFDSVRSTQPYDAYDERFTWFDESAIDIAGQPNYFFNNESAAPFDSWDFVNDWQVQTNDYPLLRVQPSQPTDVSVTPGLTSLTVSWNAPTNSQQAPITGYRLEYVKAGKTAMTVIPITNPTTHSYTITGLDASTDYALRLRAINQAGDGDVVSFASSTSPAGASTLGMSTTSSGSSSGISVTSAPSSSTLFSSETAAPTPQTANNVTAAVTQATPIELGASPKPASKTVVSLSDATTTHKKSTNSAWWWLCILPIAVGTWFWRRHKTSHV